MSYVSISFPGTARYLSEVRMWTTKILGDVPEAADVVQIVSELAANAVLHTASGEEGGSFTLHIATYANRWQIRMDDHGGPTAPAVLTPATDDEAGRGLAIVEALADAWGVVGDEYGRAVWAEVGIPEEPCT